jgi:hypothetical protein
MYYCARAQLRTLRVLNAAGPVQHSQRYSPQFEVSLMSCVVHKSRVEPNVKVPAGAVHGVEAFNHSTQTIAVKKHFLGLTTHCIHAGNLCWPMNPCKVHCPQ